MNHKHVFESTRGSQGDHFGSLICKCGRVLLYERPKHVQPVFKIYSEVCR